MEGITSMDRLKVVRSVKPYYFYLICEGAEKVRGRKGYAEKFRLG